MTVIQSREFDGFNHNMFVIDGQPSGPGFVARFPFEPRPMNALAGLVEVRGHEIVFLKELQADERVLVQLQGYGATAGDHQFALENQNTGAGVKMWANKPLVRLIFWSRPHAVGPEPYIHLHVQPGQAEEWETRYLFYTLK